MAEKQQQVILTVVKNMEFGMCNIAIWNHQPARGSAAVSIFHFFGLVSFFLSPGLCREEHNLRSSFRDYAAMLITKAGKMEWGADVTPLFEGPV